MAAMGYLRCSHESSGSKSNMAANSLSSPKFDTLPEELLVEILQRLSQEDVGQCECVCKHWFDLLSSPHFARCYNRHRSLPPRFALFFQRTRTEDGPVPVNQRGVYLANEEEAHTDFNSPRFSFSFLPPFTNQARLLASSNGLVLCSTFNLTHEIYLVCNPYTMHWVALPPPPSCHDRVSIGFICNPDFDINGTTSLFKVVRIPQFKYKSEPYTSTLKLEIFSSETWEWAESVISLPKFLFGSTSLCNDAFVCNGMLHWRYVNRDYILAFDPCKQEANHEARAIELPKESCEGASIHLVGESRSRLTYAEFHEETFRVWKFGEDQGISKQWHLVYEFHESEFVWEDPEIAIFTTSCLGLMHIVAFHPFEEDYVFLVLPGHIIECNLRSRVLKSVFSVVSRSAELHYRVLPYVLPWWPIQILKGNGNPLVRR